MKILVTSTLAAVVCVILVQQGDVCAGCGGGGGGGGATPVTSFTPKWKDFNAADRNVGTISVIYFCDEKSKALSDQPVPDMGGASGINYIRVVVSTADLKEAKKIKEESEKGAILFDCWDKKEKTGAEIAAAYGVTSLPATFVCDRQLNVLKKGNASILAQVTTLIEQAAEASDQLEKKAKKELEQAETSFAKEKEKGEYTLGTIKKLMAVAGYNSYGENARSMLKEINAAGEKQLADAIGKNDKKRFAEIASLYKGLPISVKAGEEAKKTTTK